MIGMSTLGNLFKSGIGRAAVGGAAGGMMTGDWGGVAGGAAMGAGGWGAMKKYGPRVAGRGLRQMGRGAAWAGGKLGGSKAFDMTVGGAARGWGQMGLNKASRGLITAAKSIGNNRTMTNKWAGRGMAAMGVGAGAYIGSSVLSSNRGY